MFDLQNHEKIYVKSEIKAVLLRLIANVQSDNSFLWCSKFAPWELSAPAPAPAPYVQKMVFGLWFFYYWEYYDETAQKWSK